jgi:hypothetical protein
MKTFYKKPVGILTMFCMITVLISSCKKNDDTYEPVVYGDANIRVVNTVSGSNAQDFYQGDTKLSTTAIAYGENTPSIKLKAGNSIISLKSTGTTTTTTSSNTLLETNINYTFFYYTNLGGAAQFNGLIDNNAAPATGKVKVRFLNLGSALNNTLNISITGGSVVVTGIGFANATDYYSLDANSSLDFTVLSSGITGNIPGTNFVSGKIYTVWFDAATSTTAKFHIIQQN